MDVEIQEAIIRAFPELCAGCSRPPTESLMAFGFDVGNGWTPIILRMCSRLDALRPRPQLEQVKEKFGLLRVYFRGGRIGRVPWWRWPIAVAKAVLFELRWKVPGWRWGWRYVLRSAYEYGRDSQVRWTETERLAGLFVHAQAAHVVEDAEADSATTCEECGAPGRLRGGGWRLTLCDVCEAKRGR